MNPLVTICIPTYKRLVFLREAVQSALSQTYDNIEILIGQDPLPNTGSLDEAIREYGQSMAAAHHQVRYQFNDRPRGLAGNWNALAKAAKGEYLVIIGDDDHLLPNFVETLLRAAQPTAQVVFSNHYLIDSQSRRLESETRAHTRHFRRDQIPAGPLEDAEMWVWQNSIPMSACLIMTSSIQRLGFDNNLNCPEIEFFIRLVHENGRFVFVPDYLAEYRIHSQQDTAGGLTIDRLASNLVQIAVRPEIEKYKAEFLSLCLPKAVSLYLLDGEVEEARQLYASRYYPHQKPSLLSMIQKVCLACPKPLGAQLYFCLHKIKSRF